MTARMLIHWFFALSFAAAPLYPAQRNGYCANPRDVGDLPEILEHLGVRLDLPDSVREHGDWPHNEFGDYMPRSEIVEAVTLALNCVASVMPRFNWHFTDTVQREQLVLRFRGGGLSSSTVPPWYINSSRTITIGSGDVSFHRLDFANSLMRYRYDTSWTNPEFNQATGDWSTIVNYRYFGTHLGPHWGNKDLAAYILHEFFHLITGGHLNMDNNSDKSPEPTATRRTRFCSRETDPSDPVGAYSSPIVLVQLRHDNILGNDALVSPSVCISSCPGGWNLRAMTDIDADRLATGRCTPVLRYSEFKSGTVSVDKYAKTLTGYATRFGSDLTVGAIVSVAGEYVCIEALLNDTLCRLAGPSYASVVNQQYRVVAGVSYTVATGYLPGGLDQTVPAGNPHQGYEVCYPELRMGWRIAMQHRMTGEIRYLHNWHDAQALMGWSATGDPSPVDSDWFVTGILDDAAWRNTAASLRWSNAE